MGVGGRARIYTDVREAALAALPSWQASRQGGAEGRDAITQGRGLGGIRVLGGGSGAWGHAASRLWCVGATTRGAGQPALPAYG